MKILVIVPTYNERENLQQLLPHLLALDPIFDVLVVDDNSPDGTREVVESFIQKTHGHSNQNADLGNDKRVYLLAREQKNGLGRAYIAGFKWGLERGYEALIEMDADFSHRPHDLVRMIDVLPQADFLVGSRYVKGGGTLNWGWTRKMISRGGSFYSRLILGYPLRDWTGGFNAWKAPVLRKMSLDDVQSNGYSFQIELKYKALKLGFHGIEVPILFEDRRVGKSKMSLKIVLEAFYRVWLIRY
jgi:dolichol-phosphate mannosyltransferase